METHECKLNRYRTGCASLQVVTGPLILNKNSWQEHIMFFGILFALIAFFVIKNTAFTWETALYLAAVLLEMGLVRHMLLYCLTRRPWRILFGAAICVIYMTQIASLWMSTDFISVLAFQNITYLPLLINTRSVALLLVLAAIGTGGLWAELHVRRTSKRNTTTLLSLVLASAVAMTAAAYFGWGYTYTPAVAYARNLFRAVQSAFQPAQYGIPPVQEHVYRRPLPFASSVSRPNVIVFFMEGTSKRSLTEFHRRYPGITPHLQTFMDASCEITQYYSHTSATFRGIQGSLCSSYPYYGGNGGWMQHAEELKKQPYPSLMHILAKQGYRTVFFDPHGETDKLKFMLQSIGVETILTGEQCCSAFLDVPYASITRHNAIPDRELFESLTRYLDSGPAQPFFIGVYNLETHAFVDTASNGVKYGDGKNISLNTIHNYDTWFGKFWNWFVNSPLKNNTMVILTADHGHFPEPPFCAVAGKDFTHVFVDEIPFYIYAPFMNLPKTYSSGGLLSSLDLAPTLCHLLSINVQNHFMGKSVFERTPAEYVMNWQGEGFLITKEGIFSSPTMPKKYKKKFSFELAAIAHSKKKKKD